MEAQAAKRAELEEKLRANEEQIAAQAAEIEREKELRVFGILVTGWVRQIEAGTVDWADLIERLEAALETARRLHGEAR